jgi:hypothetical protein
MGITLGPVKSFWHREMWTTVSVRGKKRTSSVSYITQDGSTKPLGLSAWASPVVRRA